MSICDPRQIYEKLHRDGILVSFEWVDQCVQYLREEQNTSDHRLLLSVQEQWLTSDLNISGLMERSIFPPNLSSIFKWNLNGKICLQVNFGYDIGNPAYGQLQKIFKLENENARVSADDTEGSQSGYQPSQGRFVASWEPKSSRMLSLNLTDGFQTFQAIEHERIEDLPNLIPPGLKIELSGPLVCRKGKIFLRRHSVKVLGGEVEEMIEKCSTENILTEKVGRRIDVPKFAVNPPSTNNPAVSLPRVQGGRPDGPPVGVDRPSTSTNQSGRQVAEPADLFDSEWDDDFPMDDWDNDDFPNDDETLLMAVNEVENSQQSSVDENPDDRQPLRNLPNQLQTAPKPQQVARIQPLVSHNLKLSGPKTPKKVVEPVTPKKFPKSRTPSKTSFSRTPKKDSGSITPKKTIQTSIDSFLKPKKPKLEPEMPDFNLEGDLGLFSDAVSPMTRKCEVVSSEPFLYLVDIKEKVKACPERRFFVTVKAVSSTLAGGIKVRKTSFGFQWFISLYINDGSDFIQAEISPEMLDNELGSAAAYTSLTPADADVKATYKENLKKFSKKLASLSGIIKLRFPGEGNLPVIEAIEPVTSLHLAKMRRRRLREI